MKVKSKESNDHYKEVIKRKKQESVREHIEKREREIERVELVGSFSFKKCLSV